MPSQSHILTINAGSSSIRFAVFDTDMQRRMQGKVQRIGLAESSLTGKVAGDDSPESFETPAPDHKAAMTHILNWLQQRIGTSAIAAIGHRVVHGGTRFAQAERITPDVLEQLRTLAPLAPEHLPAEIAIIGDLSSRFPQLAQVACFDTAFHHNKPRLAKLIPIPREYEQQGIQRYGFHGLSYEYLVEELRRIGEPDEVDARLILAHLGNGASLAAVRHGSCIDTSMGFTPASGLVMGTRCGDLDPGVAWYLLTKCGMSSEDFYSLINRRSGLLGISETSSDMRDLLDREADDARAAEAVTLFCYQARKWMGAFAAALGGLDTLVFSGGIGENAPEIRKRICNGLGFLGIDIDSTANDANESVISSPQSQATVRVIPTDEELMIARKVKHIIDV